MTNGHAARPPLSRDDVIRVVGALEDGKVAAIIATGADIEDLTEAFAWANAEDDVLGDQRKSLTGTVAQVYDILTADDPWDDDR